MCYFGVFSSIICPTVVFSCGMAPAPYFRRRTVRDHSLLFFTFVLDYIYFICSDRILTCRIKSIRSPAKVGLVVTDLITSPVVSWEGWETPPPAPRLCCLSLLNHRRGKTSLLLW